MHGKASNAVVLTGIKPTGLPFEARNLTRNRSYGVIHQLSDRQLKMVMAGGLIDAIRQGR